MVIDDCSLLAAHRAGDPDAFGRLYDRHAAVVLSFCRRDHDGEDAMQETFIRAHSKLDQVSDCTGFRTWLLAIAGFVLRERRRSVARYSRHVRESAPAAGLHGAASAPSDASAAAERRETLRQLGEALDALPDDERLAIHLQYLEVDPGFAATGALGLSRSGYYKLLARARERLAGLMSETARPEANP